jgi:heptosyltransferase I
MAMKILLVKTSSLGDVIHCLPVIHDIHAHFPNAQIDWVVEESFVDIPRLHKGVNQVITIAMRRWKKQLLSQRLWIKTRAEIATFKELIKQNQYDAIIDTQGLLKSALIMRYANGVKHGYDKNSIREPIASWFYDKTYNISYNQHAVTRNRTLCAMSMGYETPINAPNYGITPTNDASANLMDIGLQACSQMLESGRAYIIALHGTSRDSKLWPVENWVNLGRELTKQNLNFALPWASDAELARAQQIASQLENASVLPKLSIAQIATVISRAKAAIGVDTGLSHLAAALNIPTIAIYTDTNPALTGVMGGAFKPAINLGGIAQTPNVSEILESFKKIL